MEERNSEKWVTYVLGGLSILAIAANLVVTGLIPVMGDAWPWLAAVNVPLLTAAGVAWAYIKGRAPKHAAMAQRVTADVYKAFVEAGGSPAALPLPGALPTLPPAPPDGPPTP